MRLIEIAGLVGFAAVVVFLIALDAKSKMTWLGVGLGVIAVVVAIYAGVDFGGYLRSFAVR